MKSALVDDPLYASTAALRKQGALLDAWFDDPECAQIECVLTLPPPRPLRTQRYPQLILMRDGGAAAG